MIPEKEIKAKMGRKTKRLPFKGSVSSSKVDSVLKEIKREQMPAKSDSRSEEDRDMLELGRWVESIIEANEDTMIFTPEEVRIRVKKFLENQRSKEVSKTK